jgi:hypothetical protein
MVVNILLSKYSKKHTFGEHCSRIRETLKTKTEKKKTQGCLIFPFLNTSYNDIEE